MDKIKFLQSCNLGSSFSKMVHHSFYILSIKCKPKDFLSISWRYRTIDPQNGCHVGNGIYVLTFVSLNEVGTWVRATIGLPSWIFFVHIHCRNAADFKLFKQLTFEKASFKLRFWCRKNGSSLLGIFSGYFWTSSHGLVIYFTCQPIARCLNKVSVKHCRAVDLHYYVACSSRDANEEERVDMPIWHFY